MFVEESKARKAAQQAKAAEAAAAPAPQTPTPTPPQEEKKQPVKEEKKQPVKEKKMSKAELAKADMEAAKERARAMAAAAAAANAKPKTEKKITSVDEFAPDDDDMDGFLDDEPKPAKVPAVQAYTDEYAACLCTKTLFYLPIDLVTLMMMIMATRSWRRTRTSLATTAMMTTVSR